MLLHALLFPCLSPFAVNWHCVMCLCLESTTNATGSFITQVLHSPPAKLIDLACFRLQLCIRQGFGLSLYSLLWFQVYIVVDFSRKPNAGHVFTPPEPVWTTTCTKSYWFTVNQFGQSQVSPTTGIADTKFNASFVHVYFFIHLLVRQGKGQGKVFN